MASESHNPFRRKHFTSTNPVNTHAADDHLVSSTIAPSSSDFARALSSLGSPTSSHAAAPPPAVTFAKPKPVKKVRVQSPPPSSPESAGAEHPYPKYPLPPRDDDDDSSSDDGQRVNGARVEPEDPFRNEAPPLPEGVFAGVPLHRLEPVLAQQQQQQQQTQSPAWTASRGPPPNPFQKTLEDMERESKDGAQGSGDQASPAAKTGMDVEAFKRLLLTGQGPTPSPGGDTGTMTETSSVSRQSILENTQLQETPRTSHETEPDDEKRTLLATQSTSAPQRSSSRRKKPPPPPATRHGKLIKTHRSLDLEGRPTVGFAATSSPNSPPSDFNKPLPAPPQEEAAKNIFDKEAAGRLPELDIDPNAAVVPSSRPPTPPNVHQSVSSPMQSPGPYTLRKPLPPPRRTGGHHGRSGSKPPPPTDAVFPDEALTTTPTRSSMESQRSRSSSVRVSIAAAPAPPPPRRGASMGAGGAGQTRQSPGVTSPGSGPSPSFPFPASPDGSDPAAAGPKNPRPPVPPPQRNPSSRKSPSVSRGNSSKGALPPPPPPRARGSSKGSLDGAGAGVGGGLARTQSVDSAVSQSHRAAVGSVAEQSEVGAGEAASMGDDAVQTMLADIEALQREVDAARAHAEGGGS